MLTKAVLPEGRRWDDGAALVPAQRVPSSHECIPEQQERSVPRPSRARTVLARAPFDPQSGRIVLVGLLCFGALVSELSSHEHADPGPSGSQHGPAEPGVRR